MILPSFDVERSLSSLVLLSLAAPPNMDPSFLQYDGDYNVLIYLKCRRRVPTGDKVSVHLRNVHQQKGAALKAMVQYGQSLPPASPEVQLPPHGSRRRPGLGPPVDGFSCGGCGYLTINRNNIIHHCSRTRHAGPTARWTGVKLQTWSPGNQARYWIVMDSGVDTDGIHSATLAEEAPEGLEELVRTYEAELAHDEAEYQQTVQNPQAAENVAPFIQHTGFAEHLAGKKLPALRDTSLMPRRRQSEREWPRIDPEERAREDSLTHLVASVERVLARCCRRLKSVPHEVLEWLHSVDPAKPDQGNRPFKTKDEVATMERYRLWAKRYLCYCVRAARLGRQRAQEQHGIQFDERQWGYLRQIVERLGERLREQGQPSRSVELEEPDDPQLDRDVFEFWIASVWQKVAFRVFINPLLHFCAVLGVAECDGSGQGVRAKWKRARDYTGQLAGLLWCIRVLALEHIFRDQTEDPSDMEWSAIEHFRQQHREWLVNGSFTPVSTIVRWMSYGKGIRTKEGGMPKVLWEADRETFRFLGQQIRVEDFQLMARRGLQETEALLDELTFGPWAELRSRIDLGRIQDSLVHEGSGASFATDPRNRWLQPGAGFLLRRCEGQLCARGAGSWHLQAVLKYLRTLKRFKRQLVRDGHIWGG